MIALESQKKWRVVTIEMTNPPCSVNKETGVAKEREEKEKYENCSCAANNAR